MRTRRLIAAAVLAAGLCAGQVRAIDSAGSGFWDVGATWSGSVVPTNTDDVYIMNTHTVTVRDVTTHDVGSLTIHAGGVLTHTANSSTEAYKCILNIVSNLTIEAGGEINVDDRGYSADNGPGKPVGSCAGGSHGGIGGSHGSYTASRGTTYGSVIAPTNCGSGGGSLPGGGAVILTVGGATALNGWIHARGTTPADYTFQGSGGSVFLTTGTLSGNGTIDASSTFGSSGGGGGGGRIAVILTNSTDFGAVKMQAFGANSTRAKPAGGTIYLQHKDHAAGKGKLIVDFGDIIATTGAYALQNGQEASSYEFSEIVLTNRAVYAIDTNDTLIITNTIMRGDPANTTDGIYVMGGTLTVPANFGFTNYVIAIHDAASTFNPTVALIVGSNATLRANAPYTLNCPVTIESGGIMDHDQSANIFKINLDINGSLDIQTGGAINVDGKGYGAGSGPGAAGANAAGGYGGTGAAHSGWPQNLGLTYGSITAPTDCGSGGSGSSGGGAAILRVTGATTLNGSILARGAGSGDYEGSGGAVFLTTAILAGSGTINAGAYGATATAPGGGGRISLILTNGNDFGSVKMLAYSYTTGQPQGSPGTIYTQTRDQGPGKGTLLIDANNITPGTLSSTLIRPQVTDTLVGSVIVTNAAKLAVSNATLTIQGDLENTASVTGYLNGTVNFSGTNAARIRGQNTFYNFVCTNIGEILSFQDARTNTVDGVLTLANITLNSISGGQWYLKASAFTHSVTNVNVSWSDARPGSAIEAFVSVNGGNNYNWVFGESGSHTNYWTGAEDSDWTKTNNWSRNRSTQLNDTVVVTNGSLNSPLLQAATRFFSLVISNGATMGLNKYNLVVDDDVRVAGTLTASGTENLTIGGDLDFTGGTFNAATSTVWIAGSNAQVVVSDNESFRNLSISNSAAAVTFTDAVSATNIVNYSTPVTFGGTVTALSSIRTVGTNVIFGGAVNVPSFYNETGALVFSGTVTTVGFTNWGANLTFRDNVMSDWFYSAPGGNTHTFGVGKMVTVGNLEWYGRGGNPLTLRSLEDGKAWDLNVTNWSKVRQVDVKDSNAQPGLAIVPVAYANSGGNTNWVFGGPWQTWNGTVSSSFTNGSNWTPAGVPDGSACLLVEGYTATGPVLSGVATVQCVVVGSVTTGTLTVNGTLTTLGDFEILPNGTVTHSANAGSEANRLYMTVGSNLTIYGQINVDGRGYAAGNGPGKGGSLSAGGYGGMGGYYNSSPNPGTTYGSITAPTNCGSGGAGGAGGGAVVLTVGSATVLNGSILARAPYEGYQGSGGSAFLTTGTFAGIGTIDVGIILGETATGGGGRIAVILTDGEDFGGVKFRAFSRSASHSEGSPGTIYTQTKTQGSGKGMLLIDAGGLEPGPYSTTLIHPGVTDATVGTLIVTNMAKLAVSNATLTVQGDWINKATFIAQTNGTVDFAGTNTSTIYTNNTFYNLTCTNAGKTLSFEAGRTNTVTGLLKLGASQSGQMVTLQSTVGGSWSYLTLVPGGTQQIARVNVKDNNAGGGQTLLANVGSANGGNNINWQFPPSGTMFMVK